MIQINDNKIITKYTQLEFTDKKYEAAEYKNRLVIVFNTDKDDGYDNVYCYTNKRELLWRINPVPAEIGGTVRTSYVGVDIIDGICRIIDFFGRRFIVDILNGKILSKDIVK